MKPAMLFGIAMLAVIILMSSFGLHLGSGVELNIPDSVSGSVLYLCPATSSGWDSAAKILSGFTLPITVIFFFAAIILLFSWGWALYQNLLKDKFNKDSFKNAWGFTKIFFWAGVIVLLIIFTPNHFRTVNIIGHEGNYVLCEKSSQNAIAVREDAVISSYRARVTH
ncbi:MAG: hypothetical protein KBS86_02010 [Proteobacteria bacterium]|nr:hypothetical protein [Candidatus Enterousia scatequi]